MVVIPPITYLILVYVVDHSREWVGAGAFIGPRVEVLLSTWRDLLGRRGARENSGSEQVSVVYPVCRPSLRSCLGRGRGSLAVSVRTRGLVEVSVDRVSVVRK